MRLPAEAPDACAMPRVTAALHLNSPIVRPSVYICSPDGQRAALDAEVGGITLLDFRTGQRRPFDESPDSRETYEVLAWKADGSGLLAHAITPFNFYPCLVLISYPGAIRTQITHDLDSYRSPGLTADDTMIVAHQGDAHSQFGGFSLPLIALNPETLSFPNSLWCSQPSAKGNRSQVFLFHDPARSAFSCIFSR